jgi:uncharacterized protein YndB with AHSA1/START domain
VLTNGADVVGWLANEARCDVQVGTAYELRWHTGYMVRGKVTAAEKDALYAVTWQGTNEPAETTVTFSLTATRGGTRVDVNHSGFGRGKKWTPAVRESRKGWALGLQNLKHLVETGIDLREASRPMLGINLGQSLSPELISKKGIDTQTGVYLDGVIDGLSAQAAGMKEGDVITAVGGKPVPDYFALVSVMQGYKAGDRVEVNFVRGKEHKTAMLELKPRPMPDVPATLNALVAAVKEKQSKFHAELTQVFANVSDEKAARRPAADEWSAKEVLAHLSIAERDLVYYLGNLLAGIEEPYVGGNPNSVTERYAAVLAAAPTIDALLRRLAADQAETVALVAALRPEIVANKARYRRIGRQALDMADHIHEHMAQITAALAAP